MLIVATRTSLVATAAAADGSAQMMEAPQMIGDASKSVRIAASSAGYEHLIIGWVTWFVLVTTE